MAWSVDLMRMSRVAAIAGVLSILACLGLSVPAHAQDLRSLVRTFSLPSKQQQIRRDTRARNATREYLNEIRDHNTDVRQKAQREERTSRENTRRVSRGLDDLRRDQDRGLLTEVRRIAQRGRRHQNDMRRLGTEARRGQQQTLAQQIRDRNVARMEQTRRARRSVIEQSREALQEIRAKAKAEAE